MVESLGLGTGVMNLSQFLRGYLAVANEIMAQAVKTVPVPQGYEPADYALVAFGGAGGLHACAVAGVPGTGTVLLPAETDSLLLDRPDIPIRKYTEKKENFFAIAA